MSTTASTLYSQPQQAMQQQAMDFAPTPKFEQKPKTHLDTFYERLKAEIDEWLSSVRVDLCLR